MNVVETLTCSCRVCGSPEVKYLCDTHNKHSETRTLSNFKCKDCGSVFVGNEINGEELGNAYSTLNSARYYAEIESENRKKMTTAISELERYIDRNQSIIDIGTGDGQFVELLHEAGFENLSAHEIEGSDLSRIRAIAREIYEDFDYSTIPSNSFDTATLLDVVEHVIDPRYLIKTCARILKQGGLIYFHTPVVTRTDRLMHVLQKTPILKKAGTIWQTGRTSIFHLENYTPRSLEMLLNDAGFRDIDIRVANELSWPVSRYVKTYLLEKQGLPGSLAPILAPFFYPLLATDLCNANKAIVSAKKT